MGRWGIAIALAVSVLASRTHAQPAVTGGSPEAPFPGPWAISLEWSFSGDDNENAEVAVRYRERDGAWRDAQSLLRVPTGERAGFSFGGRFAGSIFSLRPSTDYEVELSLNDPDGGNETERLDVRTREIPTIDEGELREMNVTPESIDAALRDAGPGSLLTLAPGMYGRIVVPNDGSADAPLVLRGAPGAIVDGDLRIDGRSHVWVFGMEVRGQIKFNNAEAIVLRFLHVRAMGETGDGIVSFGDGVQGAFISDNVVEGQTSWAEGSLGVRGDNIGEGIAVTGPGNVIAYNRVIGFRDCVSLLEDSGARRQFSIDIIGNDLDICADDAIEADFAMGNVRVIGNRIHRSFIALSSQPGLGGPTYFIRNVVYNNVFQAFKPNRSSVGDIWYHNTVVKRGDAMGVYTGDVWSHARFRNNLFIGGPGGESFNGFSTGSGRVYDLSSLDLSTSSLDYNGLGMVDVDGLRSRLGSGRFDSFADLQGAGHETHGVALGLDVFASPPTLPPGFFGGEAIPDFRLGDGAAIDRGQVLANINDGFAGAGPDLGAHERGSTPHFGPRGDASCGNGTVEAGETCDDGNTEAGDGCDELCQVEAGDAGMTDAGLRSDAGLSSDGGAAEDAGAIRADAGDESEDTSGGCSCRTVSPDGQLPFPALAFLALVLARQHRRRRRTLRNG